MGVIEERFMIKDGYRKGVSMSGIARRTGRDRKTIRQSVSTPFRAGAPTPRQPKPWKMDPYIPSLEQRMEEGVLNACTRYGDMVNRGYPGGETQLRAFLQKHRPERSPQATTRLETAPGEQGQVDGGHFGFMTHQGHTCRLSAFVLTLGWSRAMDLRVPTSMEQIWFIRGHLPAFSYLGGVPRRLLDDTLKSVGIQHDADGAVHWKPRVLDVAEVARCDPQACRPSRPQTKGNVENGVKDVRGNVWQGVHFQERDDLTVQAWRWLNTVATRRVHGTTHEVPFTRLPQERLLPAEGALTYDTRVIAARRARRECVISSAGNLSSLPSTDARQSVQGNVTEAEDLVMCSAHGTERARHRLRLGSHQRSVQPQHSQGLPIPRTLAARGRPTAFQQGAPLPPAQPFWDAPVVEVRSLSVSDQLRENLP